MTSDINIIVAVDRRMGIGRNGNLLYHISADLKNFKRLTTGHTVIMGRKTFDSLPNGALPNRRNIVISHNTNFTAPGAEVFPSLEGALDATEAAEKVFLIGGATVYQQALPVAKRLFLTEIDAETQDADTFFPPVDPAEWGPCDEEPDDVQSLWTEDAKSGLRYRFICLSRK